MRFHLFDLNLNTKNLCVNNVPSFSRTIVIVSTERQLLKLLVAYPHPRILSFSKVSKCTDSSLTMVVYQKFFLDF